MSTRDLLDILNSYDSSSLKPTKKIITPKPKLLSKISFKNAQKFKTLADNMQTAINDKLNPATADQTPTRRRSGIIASMQSDGEHLQKIQTVFYKLAELWKTGQVPPILQAIQHKAVIDTIIYYDVVPEKDWREAEYKRIAKLKLTNPKKYQEARELILSYIEEIPIDKTKQTIDKMERDLIGVKIPGYFSTPLDIVKQMIMFADIQPDMQVLEPSAGNGNIADEIKTQFGDSISLSCIEPNYSLREILTLKEHTIIANDFLKHTEKDYDRIVQNPPFGKPLPALYDVDHLYHAYKLLKDDGILVSIMSHSPFFQDNEKALKFRNWLDSKDHQVIELGSAFKKSNQSTGVQTKLVVIHK